MNNILEDITVEELKIKIDELETDQKQLLRRFHIVLDKLKSFYDGEIASLVKPLDWQPESYEEGRCDIYAEINDNLFRISEKDDAVYLYYGEEEIDFPTVAEAKQYAQKLVEDFVCAACGYKQPENPRLIEQ